jgi:hypothetical protein
MEAVQDQACLHINGPQDEFDLLPQVRAVLEKPTQIYLDQNNQNEVKNENEKEAS